MFVHTKLTKIACWIMVINTFISFTSLFTTLVTLETPTFASNLELLPLLIVMVINACVCIGVYRNRLLALRLSTWFYAIQILSYESQSLSFNLNAGLQLTLSWPASTGVIAINFAVLAISVLSHVAYASVKKPTGAPFECANQPPEK